MLQQILSNPLLLGFVLLAIANIVLIAIILWMYLKLKKFLVGVDSKHIGDSLVYVKGELGELKDFRSELEKYLEAVENRLRKSIRSVHTVRFNPFKGTGGGGNQSFATAFMNEEGDGVIVSSLYSREHVSVFSKPVKNHASEFELSDEEREALENAKSNL